MHKIIALIFVVFFSAFVVRSAVTMSTIPFHDFDEAHRAEKAKKMKEYVSFLVPLTGSPQDRNPDLRVPLKENPNLFLYYHPERPPFVYWMMIAATNIFGTSEWAYRLPSFLAGILTVGVLSFFILKFTKGVEISAFFIALLSLITSGDLWLSSQYAQLDTSLTFFLFAALLSLITYSENKKFIYILFSGLSFALAILSKGQPAIIFIFPLVFLFMSKKLMPRDIFRFFASTGIILIPWFFLLEIYFELFRVLEIFTKFAVSSSAVEYSFIKAPFFWYIRWWWDTLRPGFTLFLALLIFDAVYKNFTWKKLAILSYIFGGLTIFSLSINKIWWYVLPLIPAIAYYIYLSSSDYLNKRSSGLINISLVIILASTPYFYAQTNTVILIYGACLTLISFILIFLRIPEILVRTAYFKEFLFCIAVFSSLAFFYGNFPKIVPYHRDTKFVAEYYKSLPGQKCLWIKDMPPETALFYSNAGEILTLTENIKLFPDCENFLITPSDIEFDELNFQLKGQLYKLKNHKILFQLGSMKLIRL